MVFCCMQHNVEELDEPSLACRLKFRVQATACADRNALMDDCCFVDRKILSRSSKHSVYLAHNELTDFSSQVR